MKLLSAIALLAAFALSGCAATQIEKGSGEENIAIQELSSFTACNKVVFGDPDTAGMKDDQAFMVKMQAQTTKLVASATGKNPCMMKTFRDVQPAEVVEKNKTAQVAINRGADVAGTAVITAGAVKIADSAFGAAGDTVGGDKTTTSSGRDAVPTKNTTTTTETNTNSKNTTN